MKVLLIEPPWYAFFGGARQPVAPLGNCYLAAVLRQDHDVRIFNPDLKPGANALNNDYRNEMDDYRTYLANMNDPNDPVWRELENLLLRFRPDLVGLSAKTPAIYSAFEVARLAKRLSPEVRTVVGGPHVSALPQHALSCDAIDFAVPGEGEIVVRNLVEALERGTEVEAVRGIAYRKEGRVVINPPQPPIRDLDSIPFPAKELIINAHLMEPDDFCSVFASRGCFARCTFCGSWNTWTRKMRFRSPANVLAEIIQLHETYHTEFFSFQDDTFTANRRLVVNLCQRIRKYPFRGNFRWVCNTRPDCIDDELVAQMKDAGCTAIALGIETGSALTMERIAKGFTLEDCRKAVEAVKKHGLVFSGQFMIGFPWETEKEIEETVAFMRELDPVSVMLSVAAPLPGTDLYALGERLGLFDPASLDYAALTTKNDGLLVNPELKGERWERIFAWARAAFDEKARENEDKKYRYKLSRSDYQDKRNIPFYGEAYTV